MAAAMSAATPATGQIDQFPKKLGVATAGVQRSIEDLPKAATFTVKGQPDWMAVTEDSVWVSSADVNRVTRLDARTNAVGTVVEVNNPCSGLVADAGGLWVPSCGDHSLVRVDAETGALQATIPVGPADSEGGITAGAGSIWLVTADGELTRIDAATNRVTATIAIPAGSFNPLYASGSVWVSSNTTNALVRVDPSTNKVVSSTPIGPKPRFLAAGAGSIWVLNQGDGSVSRVDAAAGKLLATIPAGIPGHGGEIAFGAGSVWATVIDFPLTKIDPTTNRVVAQWRGAGGGSVRFGHGRCGLRTFWAERSGALTCGTVEAAPPFFLGWRARGPEPSYCFVATKTFVRSVSLFVLSIFMVLPATAILLTATTFPSRFSVCSIVWSSIFLSETVS
jgi:virginiamycin B lyase